VTINFAHVRERSASGGWIDFAVFDAHSTSGSDSANSEILANLTSRVRLAGRKVDQSALVYLDGGRITFYGSKHLVDYLSRNGVPSWTHKIDV